VGKICVIEDINGFVGELGATIQPMALVRVFDAQGLVRMSHYYGATQQPAPSGFGPVWFVQASPRFYVQPGEWIQAELTGLTTEVNDISLTLSGHLVNAP
jgi:hypothetical protein